jgi:hypothetical protein
MAKTGYPVLGDMDDFLQDAGITTTGLDMLDALAAGISAFERETGRTFYVAAAVTRTYDPPTAPSGVLPLKADLISSPTPTVSYQGTLMTAATDYRFLPANAPGEGKPYNRVEFLRRWYWPVTRGDWDQISIVGKFVYAATIPEDAWRGMLTMAGLELAPQIAQAISLGLVSWTEADVTENYGQKPLQGLIDQWTDRADRITARYKKRTVGWG